MLVVLRNPAAENRLWDLVRPLAADPRLAVVFTVDDGPTDDGSEDSSSDFSGGLPARLTELGAHRLPWAEAIEERFDLALAASDKTELHRVKTPVVLMAHGAGFNRRTKDNANEISGLLRTALVHDGGIVPACVVVAHERDLATLRAIDPRLPARALVAGDPAHHRIVRNLPLRERFRDALAVGERKLVLLCSTWGEHSLFGRNPRLPHDLVYALPVDEFAVAMTMHPNVWARHLELEVRALTRTATDGGLRLIPAHGEWRSALVAADLVISDHGSLTVYGAAAGRPVLFAADGGDEVVPGSMMDRLRRALPHLRTGEPLEPQITAALARGARDVALAASSFAAHDALAAILARAYEIMDLPVSPYPTGNDALPAPDVTLREPAAFRVVLTGAHESGGHATLRLHRVAEPPRNPVEERPEDGHLVVNEYSDDIEALENASAIFSGVPHPTFDQARTRARRLLNAFRGARMAVAETIDGRRAAVLRDGREPTVLGELPISLVCSGLHWWSLTPDRPHRITVESGTISGPMTIND
ncbi:hypothetical protein [Amycolatopsis samaneae]|uniref:Translation initiation factor 2 n=1 Tax=Amycolatopsis samaneae TaxID=664691 RepID=A0ABW5GRX7_9PSEU